MAIYHFHFKSVQRSKGMSSIPYAAYIRGVSMTDERTGLNYNFSCKDDIAHTNIMIPENSAQWIKELLHLDVPDGLDEFSKRTLIQEHENKVSSKLWNMSEQHSLKCNARTANIIDLALPCELTLEENVELLEDFIKNTYTSKGMIADYSIHYDGQNTNPHGHIILSNRELSENGFGKVNEYWNTNAFLCKQRKDWADFANLHLFTRGHNVEIDHRSYKDQGIDLEPTVHVGTGKYHDVKDRLSENNEIKQRNALKILENPSIVFDALAKQKATFTHSDLVNIARRYSDTPKQYQELISALENSENLLEVGRQEGKAIYAPRSVLVTSQEVGSSSESIGNSRTVVNEEVLKSFDKISQNNPLESLSGEISLSIIAEKVIKNMLAHNSLFNDIDIARELSKEVGLSNQEFLMASTLVKGSPEVMHLGPWIDGRETYTTKKLFNIECEIQELVDTLQARSHLKLLNTEREKYLGAYQESLPTDRQLKPEQLDAIRYAVDQNHSIANILGRSGTGKSYSLKAAQAVFESMGVSVYGVALQGVAASNLSKGGINARTIESFKWSIENQKLDLKKGDVLFIDEAGMVNSESMHFLLKTAVDYQLKIIPVGDPRQIDPVAAGATFEWIMQRVGRKELTTVYRQVLPWQRQATVDLSIFRMREGIKAYHDRGYIDYGRDRGQAMMALADDLINHKTVCGHHISEYLALAHTNDEVQDLNQIIRACRVNKSEISEGYEVSVMPGSSSKARGAKVIKIAKDDRLIFLENEKRLGVFNGSFGTVQHVEFNEAGKVLHFTALLDGEEDKLVKIEPQKYNKFDLGYAATVHKTQGLTQGFVYGFDNKSGWLRNLFYVAATRHKNMFKFFTTQKDFDSLSHSMERMSLKDSTLSFPWMFAQVRGFDPENMKEGLIKTLVSRLKQMKESILESYQRFMDPKILPEFKEHSNPVGNEDFSQEMQKREDARLVARYVDTNRAYGKAWAELREKLAEYGLKEIRCGSAGFELISHSEAYQTMEHLAAAREQLAHQIVTHKFKYTEALEIHHVANERLEHHSKAYRHRQLVDQYLCAQKEGKIVIRDRLAETINQDIKANYLYLKARAVDLPQLYKQANAHRDREFLVSLTEVERVGFKWVREYTSLNKQIYQIMKALPGSRTQDNLGEMGKYHKQLQKLQDERNLIANKILVNTNLCDRSLEYFNIGGNESKTQVAKYLTEQHFKDTANPQAYAIVANEQKQQEREKTEQMRWYRLQQQASMHVVAERVKEYRSANKVNDIELKQRLAAQIVEEAKLHHGAILREDLPAQDLWKEIRSDAKAHAFEVKLTGMTLDEQAAYRVVKEYIDLRGQCGKAWGEIFRAIAEQTGELSQVGYGKTRLFRAEWLNGVGPWVQNQDIAAELSSGKNGRLYYLDITERELSKHFIGVNDCPGQYTENSLLAKNIVLSRQEVFTDEARSKLAQEFDKRSFFEMMTPHLRALSVRRDKLANEIVSNSILYKGALVDYRIDIDKIKEQSDAHERHLLVERYSKAQGNAEKGILAQQICEASELFYREVIAQNIDWKEIRFNKRIQDNKVLFNEAEVIEKRLIRDIHAYKELNKEAGKAWMKVFSLKEAKLEVPESLNQKASLLSAKRDVYAAKVYEKYDLWEVQKDWGEISSTKRVSEYIKGSIDLDKLSLRVEKHKEKMSHAKQYVEYRELFVELLKEVMQGNKPNGKFLHMQDEFADLLKPLKKGAYSYLPSLNQLGLNVETIRKDLELIKDYEKYQEKVYESEHMQGHQPELDMERINKARKLVEKSLPIVGTLAERYLREHRGIKGEIPKSYRYLDRTYHFATEKYYPALVVLATDNKGEVYAVQRIFLDPVTANKSPDLGKMAKLTNGQMIEGVGVLVSEGQSKDRIAIAEGPETAISIKEADPTLRVYAALGSGNFRKMPHEDAKEVIMCADNDGIGAASDRKVVEAAAWYSDQGIKVYQIIPESMDGHKKTDFNDVLKAHGAGKVKEYLSQPQMIIDAVTEKSLKAKINNSLGIKEKNEINESKHREAIILVTKHLSQIDKGMKYLEESQDKRVRYDTARSIYSRILKIIQDPNLNNLTKDKYPDEYERLLRHQEVFKTKGWSDKFEHHAIREAEDRIQLIKEQADKFNRLKGNKDRNGLLEDIYSEIKVLYRDELRKSHIEAHLKVDHERIQEILGSIKKHDYDKKFEEQASIEAKKLIEMRRNSVKQKEVKNLYNVLKAMEDKPLAKMHIEDHHHEEFEKFEQNYHVMVNKGYKAKFEHQHRMNMDKGFEFGEF